MPGGVGGVFVVGAAVNICSSGHAEIVHDERECPLCTAIDERDSLDDKLGEARKEIESLTREVEKLEEGPGS